ncbi:MAG: molybdopterin molybdenumtransferase MoeA, partial [Bacteroidota bacterium]
MISVSEATQLILSTLKSFETERVTLEEANGRILRENVSADRDFPPYDRVTMDGIAIHHAAWAAGQRTFGIQGKQTAGQPAMTLDAADLAIEIMTGAMLPKGTDTVIRYEDLEFT